jgi:general secretion pathway protein G
MLCSRCGQSVPAGYATCPACGASTRNAPAASPLKRPGLITLFAVLHFISGGVCAIVALVAINGALVAKNGSPLLGFIVFIIVGGIAALQLATGIGLWKLRRYGRTLELVLSSIGLLAFPIGTIINGLVIYYLTRPGVVALFSEKQPSQLTPAERASIAELQSNGAVVVIIVSVVLLGTVFIGGILSAIAIPNLLTAIERAKQKRTMADMRAIGEGLEAYGRDTRTYPHRDELSELESVLVPKYMRIIPANDGWGKPMRYRCWSTTDTFSCNHYALVSGGKDGQFDPADVLNAKPSPINHFDCDLIFSDGIFVTYPEGLAPK